MSSNNKSYINEGLLNGLLSFNSENEKLEFEAEIIQIDFMSHIEELMDEMDLSRTELAKKMKKSSSFITQLFNGDKQLNLRHIALFQRIFDVKFEIAEKVYIDNSIIDFFEHSNEINPYYLVSQKGMKKYEVFSPKIHDSEPVNLKIA